MNPKDYLKEYTKVFSQNNGALDGNLSIDSIGFSEYYYKNLFYPECYIDTMSRSALLEFIKVLNISGSDKRLTPQQFVSYIENLRNERAGQKAEAARLSAELTNLIGQHRIEIEKQQATIEYLNNNTAEKNAEIDRLMLQMNAEVLALQTTIMELYNSTSWRIMAPMRLLSKGMANLKKAVINAKLTSWIWNKLNTTSRHIYQSLPISSKHKLRLKDAVYTVFGSMIRHTRSYQHWAAGRGLHTIKLTEPKSLVVDGDRHSNQDHMPTWFYEEQTICYVDYRPQSSIQTGIKIIAFYLPQFHPIPENDQWWGKGFTEWTNVSKAKPQFAGHYQPHLPGELGFYDLRVPEVQRRQIELAKEYGIYGFCYHHYWFGGKRLLERPFAQVLSDKTLDFPFCLCWANENWTRRWDGQEHEILMAQDHSPKDDIEFIKDIEPALRDSRYIRIEGRPVLIVYRVTLLPEPRATARRWRDYCKSVGIGDLYLVVAQSFGITDPQPYGFDAAVEFPPHGVLAPCINESLSIFNPNHKGFIYDYRYMVDFARQRTTPKYKLFRTVMPSWDNEARRPGQGNVFHYSSPALYQNWLKSVCEYSEAVHNSEERLVFVNAWNEWAEGTHLEPDRRYGYAYLQATADTLSTLVDICEQPLISVVMPAYNHDKYIAKALESVVSQTYQNLELIVVNDGSTDKTQNVIDDFLSKHSNLRVKIARQANSGSPAAIENGVQLASGDYISLINSDDIFEPARIAWMFRSMRRANAELSFTGVKLIDDEGIECGHDNQVAETIRSKLTLIKDYPHLIYALLDANIAVSTGNLMFTRKLYLDIGGFRDLRLCHDWDFVLQAVCRTQVAWVEEPLYRYRIHDSNTFSTLRESAPQEVQKTLSRFFEYIEKKPYPAFTKDPKYFERFIREHGYNQFRPAEETGISLSVD